LSLRADNADQRLTPTGLAVGLVGPVRRAAFEAKMERLESARADLSARTLTPSEARRHDIAVSQDGQRRSAFDLLGIPDVDFDRIIAVWPELAAISPETREQLTRDAMYARYTDRQASDAEALRRDEALQIPQGFDYAGLSGLSGELKAKLQRFRPASIAQAGRIEGMTPAALVLILAILKRDERKRAAG
jgi:tRNA uridine 5-carboxymethylaminomethyl modification enzyme